MMEIVHDLDKCYSCKSCQLACSYHHTGAFWPEKSSIKVSRNPQNGKKFWQIDSTCDACINEKEPLCVKFCTYGAIKIRGSKNPDLEVF